MLHSTRRASLAGLAALALAVSAVGPCHCLVGQGACQRATPEADAHACCEKPTGVQAESDACCDGSGAELVLASPEVPEVAPPMLHGSPVEAAQAGERSTPVCIVRVFPPPLLERTTVLLI